jgi:hypothetical protein
MADTTHSETPQSGRDARGAERAQLRPLTAKIVCQSGEYVCQLRDLSTLGVGLSFLHQVPPEARIILQLSNETTYPIERVWIGKRQAGYRFGCEVELADFTAVERDIRHRPIRLKFTAPARIATGSHRRDVQLVDLSCEGARIECADSIARTGLVGFELAGLAPQLATVRWQDGRQFGLAFQHKLALAELAACGLHLQPFNTSLPWGFAGLLAAARAA